MKALDYNNPYKTKASYNNSYLRQSYTDRLVTQLNISKNMLIHPKVDRIYTVREVIRLQNLPDSYTFNEKTIKPNAMYQMEANAIQSILMEEIFKTNLNTINNLKLKENFQF